MLSFALAHISLTTIAIAAAINFFAGMIWYAPFVAGRRWRELVGRHPNDPIAHSILGEVVISLVKAYGIAWFLERMNALSFVDATLVVLMAIIVFIVTTLWGLTLWEKRHIELAYINLGVVLVSFLLMAWLFAYAAV